MIVLLLSTICPDVFSVILFGSTLKNFVSAISQKEFPLHERVSAKVIRPSLLAFIQQENPSFAQQQQAPQQQPNDHNKIIVKKVKPLANTALLQYLAERRISSEIATKYLVEVYYCTYKRQDKNYFSVGFANDLQGYELRNRLFKGSSSPKAPTTIQGSTRTKKVYVFLRVLWTF